MCTGIFVARRNGHDKGKVPPLHLLKRSTSVHIHKTIFFVLEHTYHLFLVPMMSITLLPSKLMITEWFRRYFDNTSTITHEEVIPPTLTSNHYCGVVLWLSDLVVNNLESVNSKPDRLTAWSSDISESIGSVLLLSSLRQAVMQYRTTSTHPTRTVVLKVSQFWLITRW